MPLITIYDTEKLKHVMQACDEVQLSDVTSKRVADIASRMEDVLVKEIPAIGTRTHKDPAYLAANQIGENLRIVLLYLPGDDNKPGQLHVMLNPTCRVLETASLEEKKKFRISTFLAVQFRFRNDVAAVVVSYLDMNWNYQVPILRGNKATAALFGINLIFGITPLDYNISEEELLNFSKDPERPIDDKTKITLTILAYLWHKKPINAAHLQFKKDQAACIPNYLVERKKFPILFDPSTGELMTKHIVASSSIAHRAL